MDGYPALDDVIYEHVCSKCYYKWYSEECNLVCPVCNSVECNAYVISKYPGHYMTFLEYQLEARQTAVYDLPVIYPALGLAGESGEVCEKIKKIIRDKEVSFDDIKKQNSEIAKIKRDEIIKEIGDVLWYCANLCYDLDILLEDVAHLNLNKLFSRKERKVIKGNGDDR